MELKLLSHHNHAHVFVGALLCLPYSPHVWLRRGMLFPLPLFLMSTALFLLVSSTTHSPLSLSAAFVLAALRSDDLSISSLCDGY